MGLWSECTEVPYHHHHLSLWPVQANRTWGTMLNPLPGPREYIVPLLGVKMGAREPKEGNLLRGLPSAGEEQRVLVLTAACLQAEESEAARCHYYHEQIKNWLHLVTLSFPSNSPQNQEINICSGNYYKTVLVVVFMICQK